MYTHWVGSLSQVSAEEGLGTARAEIVIACTAGFKSSSDNLTCT